MKQGHWEFIPPIAALALLGGCSSFQPRAQLSIRSVEPAQQIDDAASNVEKGRALLRLGQNADAITAFRAALRDEAHSAEAHNGLAIAYDRIGRADLAQRYFELAVAGDPDNEKFRTNLARLFDRTGRPRLANGLLDQKPVAINVSTVPDSSDGGLVATALAEPAAVIAVLPEMAAPLQLPLDTILPPPLAALGPDTDGELHPLLQVTAGHARPLQAIPAVFRPSASIAIHTVAMDARSLPKPGPNRQPAAPPERIPFDIPRPAGLPLQRENVRLERVSLGEVRLVTSPAAIGSTATGAMANNRNFDSFGARLESWLPAAVRLERDDRKIMIANRAQLHEAVARARIEGAIADLDEAAGRSENAPEFSYAFFAGDTIEQVVLAKL